MSTDLAPCPFCGDQAAIYRNDEESYSTVACECGAEYSGPDADDCTTAWNRRAQPVAAIPEATGDLRTLDQQWRLDDMKKRAAIPEAGQSVPKLTDAQCHKIYNQAAVDCDEWADGLLFEPSKYEVSGFMVRAIFKGAVIASMSADAEKGGAL